MIYEALVDYLKLKGFKQLDEIDFARTFVNDVNSDIEASVQISIYDNHIHISPYEDKTYEVDYSDPALFDIIQDALEDAINAVFFEDTDFDDLY